MEEIANQILVANILIVTLCFSGDIAVFIDQKITISMNKRQNQLILMNKLGQFKLQNTFKYQLITFELQLKCLQNKQEITNILKGSIYNQNQVVTKQFAVEKTYLFQFNNYFLQFIHTQMQISQISSKNRTQTGENCKGISAQCECQQDIPKPIDLQLKLMMFSTQQSFKPSQAYASPKSTPRKNSSYSTHEEDQSFDEDFYQVCEDFTDHGACMKGEDCELLHNVKDSNSKKRSIEESVMRNFPQLLGSGMSRRVRSFLA